MCLIRRHGPGLCRAASGLAVCAALSAGCGEADERAEPEVLRLHTGDVCCFRPGSRDVGGTRTVGTGRTRAVLDLEPGSYTYLCSTGGYWRTQHGTLVVR